MPGSKNGPHGVAYYDRHGSGESEFSRSPGQEYVSSNFQDVHQNYQNAYARGGGRVSSAIRFVRSDADASDIAGARALALDVSSLGGVAATAKLLARLSTQARPVLAAILPVGEADITPLLGKVRFFLERKSEPDLVRLIESMIGAGETSASAPSEEAAEAALRSASSANAPFWMDPEEFEEIRRQATLPNDSPDKND